MDKRFAKVQSMVRGLDRCGSWIIFPHVFLDYDKWQRLPYTWEEGLPTKLAAVCEAEKLLRPLYRQAEQKFRHYTDPRSPDSFLLRFQAALNSCLSELREALGRCRTPVLLIHGEADGFVPCEMSRENYAACAAPKRLLTIPGADHAMSFVIDEPAYTAAVREFLAECGATAD